MAKAKKCDRCGKYYDKNIKHRKTCNGNTYIDGIKFTLSNGYAIDKIDLCDECINKLKELLEGETENADN